jgi:hypothetical protein
MNPVLKWYQQQKNFVKGGVVFVFNLLIAAMIFVTSFTQMGNVANDLMKPYKEADVLINRYIDSFERPACLEKKYFDAFKKDRSIVNTRKSHHLEASIIFFRNYYGVLIVLMLLSCTGGIVLFVLINKGWANAGIELQSFFLSLVFCVAFYGLFPSVFRQDDNYNKNLEQYMAYTKMELTVTRQLSYLSLQCNNSKEDSITKKYNLKVDSILDLNTQEINRLASYMLTFDASKIKSMSEVSNMVQELLNRADSSKAKKQK